MSKYFMLTAVLAIFSFTTQAWADDDDCPKGTIEGVWVKGEIVPNPIPSFCSRMFACVSQSEAQGPTMSDPACKRIYTNPPARRMVTGACSADGGAVDSCNECLASAPDDACEYHYEHD
jgi:hypothetical protein